MVPLGALVWQLITAGLLLALGSRGLCQDSVRLPMFWVDSTAHNFLPKPLAVGPHLSTVVLAGQFKCLRGHLLLLLLLLLVVVVLVVAWLICRVSSRRWSQGPALEHPSPPPHSPPIGVLQLL